MLLFLTIEAEKAMFFYPKLSGNFSWDKSMIKKKKKKELDKEFPL